MQRSNGVTSQVTDIRYFGDLELTGLDIPDPRLEDRTGRARPGNRAGNHRMPLPARHSKWNKIEHRLFTCITMNWRGRPLTSHEVIVKAIAATTTRTGLRVRAELDTGTHPPGVKISDEQMAALPLHRHDWHGDWNYTLHPAPPAPAPARSPRPGRGERPGWAHQIRGIAWHNAHTQDQTSALITDVP
jgi:hypothetical protein